VHFASFFSSGFTSMAVINQLEKTGKMHLSSVCYAIVTIICPMLS
jgi:hypothetical protein